MNKNNPLWSFERIIDKNIDHIEAFLFDVPQGVFAPDSLPFLVTTPKECILKERNNVINVEFKDGHKQFIILNKPQHELSIQGEWWYKGTYQFSALDGKTRIIFSVYNIAPYFAWIANIIVRNQKEIHEKEFEKFIEGLIKNLN